jgi:hypothetical protein
MATPAKCLHCAEPHARRSEYCSNGCLIKHRRRRGKPRKRCLKCGKAMPSTEHMLADYHRGKCKAAAMRAADKSRGAAYRARHPERVRSLGRQRQSRRADDVKREALRRWRESNPERYKAQSARRMDKICAYTSKWRAENPARFGAQVARQRHKQFEGRYGDFAEVAMLAMKVKRLLKERRK